MLIFFCEESKTKMHEITSKISPMILRGLGHAKLKSYASGVIGRGGFT